MTFLPFLRISHLTLLSVILTALTGFLGTLPLHALKHTTSRRIYSFICVGCSLLLFSLNWQALSLIFFFFSSLVFFFNELSSKKCSLFLSSLTASLCSMLLTAGAFFIHFLAQEKNGQRFQILIQNVESQLTHFLPKIPNFKSYWNIEPSFHFFFSQIPSAGLILGFFSIFLVLVLEKKTFQIFQIPLAHRHSSRYSKRLTNFKMPFFSIWVFLPALFGALFTHSMTEIKLISFNIVNLFLFLYFVQGFVILTTFLKSFKVHLFWSVLLFVFLILKLPIAISSIGFMDYWMDSREKIKKKKEQAFKSRKEKDQ